MDRHPSMVEYPFMSHVLTHFPSYGERDVENAIILFSDATCNPSSYGQSSFGFTMFYNGSLVDVDAVKRSRTFSAKQAETRSALVALKRVRGWGFDRRAT